MSDVLARLKQDPVTWVFLGLVAIAGIIYVSFEMTPSSYGMVLTQIGAPKEGPVLGTARYIREDEWAFNTPLLQATVRNGFRRWNSMSFYQEDLRNANGLPLKDWSLVFKPEMLGFFVFSPARAFSIYWALLMCGCLGGYHLLFRQFGVQPLVSAAAALMIFFSGFGQFWWTTFAPEIAGFPWILLLLLSSLGWWQKALLYSWWLPVCVFAYFYPAIIAELGFAALVILIAIRPAWFRQLREGAALAIGGMVTLAVFLAYFVEVIPIMRSTVYPGQRIATPGSTPISSVLAQFLPYVSFDLAEYRNFTGQNICESAAIGSFLPLLILCLIRYRALQNDQLLSRAIVVLITAVFGVTCWQIADAPRWMGHLLFWDMGPAQRLLLTSGLLIMFGSVLIAGPDRISVHPARIAIFILVGPVASLLIKLARYDPEDLTPDLLICGLALSAGSIACFLPADVRFATLISTITLINICVFGRFNPLQSARPIFETPQTGMVRELRQAQDASPDHVLVDIRFLGATPNGMGFRSVSHALMAPKLSVFREYFPNMDPDEFMRVFNRYCYVQVTKDQLPSSPFPNIVKVPREAFEAVRNSRRAAVELTPHKDCSSQRGGAIDRVTAKDGGLTIDGWAPWQGEDPSQELHVESARAVHVDGLLSLRRPDIAEAMKDYAFARCGFRLTISSDDGKGLSPEDIALVARNTSQGLAALPGCGCP